jgi:myo-inositol catabolism protein IolS
MIMEKVRIGKTSLQVVPVGLGANAVGGHNLFPGLNDETGRQIVRTALVQGINFIDTAYYYGLGRSEELIGEIVREYGRRDQIVIATKGGQRPVGNGQFEIDNSPAFLTQTVEESLKRLQTEYIDLFYIHFPDEKTPKAEAIGALQKLKEQGKIRAIGVSNFTVAMLEEANRDGYVDVLQAEYNLFQRLAEQDLLPYVRHHNISFIPYYPLASGLLTGKMSQETLFKDSRSEQPMFQGQAFIENLAKVEKLKIIADRYEVLPTHVVLAWYLQQPGIDAIIPGAKRPEQVIDNLRTLKVMLTPADVIAIDEMFR